MNSLRQIVAFTDLTGNAGPRPGQTRRDPTMRSVGKFVSVLNSVDSGKRGGT